VTLVEPVYGDVENLGSLRCAEESCGILLPPALPEGTRNTTGVL
jgi:hypothetical protein